jgi:hypothetical protein
MIRYYYGRIDNKPIITVCLLKEGEHTSRGIAICSPLDAPRKSTGRAIALGRAKKALKHKANSDHIEKESIQLLFIEHLRTMTWVKAVFEPFLTEYEETILKDNKEISDEKQVESVLHNSL